jgi:hypothetical protein
MVQPLRQDPWYGQARRNAEGLLADARFLFEVAAQDDKRRAASAFVLCLHAAEQIGMILICLWREAQPKRYAKELEKNLHLRKFLAASALTWASRGADALALVARVEAAEAEPGSVPERALRVMRNRLAVEMGALQAQANPDAGYFGRAARNYYGSLRQSYLYVDEPARHGPGGGIDTISRKEVRSLIGRTEAALKLLESDTHVGLAEEVYWEVKTLTEDFKKPMALL